MVSFVPSCNVHAIMSSVCNDLRRSPSGDRKNEQERSIRTLLCQQSLSSVSPSRLCGDVVRLCRCIKDQNEPGLLQVVYGLPEREGAPDVESMVRQIGRCPILEWLPCHSIVLKFVLLPQGVTSYSRHRKPLLLPLCVS